jgi:hypothetical protein
MRLHDESLSRTIAAGIPVVGIAPAGSLWARRDNQRGNTMGHLNSFQAWAKRTAEPYGFTVTPCAQWVWLEINGHSEEIMSERGVNFACFRRAQEIGIHWPAVT